MSTALSTLPDAGSFFDCLQHVTRAQNISSRFMNANNFRTHDLGQRPLAGLPGAHHHRVAWHDLGGSVAARDMQPGVVDPVIADAADHPDALHVQRRAVDPAGRFAQPLAGTLAFSLKQ